MKHDIFTHTTGSIDTLALELRARKLRAETAQAGVRALRAWVATKWAALRGGVGHQHA